jgi:hypothetical protein
MRALALSDTARLRVMPLHASDFLVWMRACIVPRDDQSMTYVSN